MMEGRRNDGWKKTKHSKVNSKTYFQNTCLKLITENVQRLNYVVLNSGDKALLFTISVCLSLKKKCIFSGLLAEIDSNVLCPLIRRMRISGLPPNLQPINDHFCS